MKQGWVVGFALLLTTQGVLAQNWQQHNWQRQQQQQYAPQQPQFTQPGRGGACVPSGFARLSRNCSANTGACQRMPDSCNRGWCCP